VVSSFVTNRSSSYFFFLEVLAITSIAIRFTDLFCTGFSIAIPKKR